ncbi:hypothetical protein ACQJBY_059178 [Aegilops geniculata]
MVGRSSSCVQANISMGDKFFFHNLLLLLHLQSNPMASGWPIFVATVSLDTCVTACVATTAICVTTCSVTGLMCTVTPGALLPLPDTARALPGLISCCSDELLYIAEVSYLTAPARGCSS